MEDSETSASLSSLLCQEDEDSLHEEFDMTNDSNYSNFNSDAITESDEEYIESLVRSETSFEKTSVLSDDCPRMSKSWLKCARLDAIKWILDARTYFGFHYRTAYLSVVYFDRFLSRRQVGNERFWVVRLLSVACLSLAAKMEEHRVPSLSDFPIEDFDFENKVIQRMELLVLNTLEWRMNTTTPFAYLGYFMLKFLGGDKTDELFSRAAELILAITKEIILMDHRPSIVAAAAVLAASDAQLSQKIVEFKINLISSWGSLSNEDILSCYNIMQEIGMGNLRTPMPTISPYIQSVNSSLTHFHENSFPSTVGTKRRLTFCNGDQNCPLEKILRPNS